MNYWELLDSLCTAGAAQADAELSMRDPYTINLAKMSGLWVSG